MRYLMTFSYDGSKYFGYQKQSNKKTIQEELEKKLTQINSNKPVTIYASGRTDAGVHATNQKAHFDLDNTIECNRLIFSLNNMIKPYIYIKEIKKVENNFHARFNVKRKKYVYKINVGEYNPVMHDYIYQYCNNLNIEEMKKAIKHFEGRHNFKSFTKATDIKEDYVREIFVTNIEVKYNIIEISFTGTGFMRYMVRNMVGILIEVGNNKRKESDIKNILLEEDRTKAGITAESNGLYLEDVFYD